MLARVAVIAVLALSATPAMATEWLTCSDGEGTEIGLLLGHFEGIAVSAVTLETGGQRWVTDPAYGDGTPIAIGQGFETGEVLVLDLLNGDTSATAAQLRLFKAEEGDRFAQGGTLRMPGLGAWPVACGES